MKSQGGSKAERPGEGHAREVAEEERRIAERRQAAADVRDQEDEEDHGVDDVLALAVRLEQRADEQHRGAGRADEGGEERPAGEEGRVVRDVAWRSPSRKTPPEITNRLREQHDEGHVVERGVDEGRGSWAR